MNWLQKLKTHKNSIPATPFIERKIELLKIPFSKRDQEEFNHNIPLSSIDENICSMRRGGYNFNSVILLTSFTVLLLIYSLFYNTIFEEQQFYHRYEIKHQVQLAKKKYGENFYLNKTLPAEIEFARYVGNDKTLSFWTELHYRYWHSKHKFRHFIIDLFMVILFQISFFLPFYLYYFRPLPPPLFIDRKRKILFTWHKGKVFVTRYSKTSMFQFYDSSSKVKIITGLGLYTQNENKKLLQHRFFPDNFIRINSVNREKKLLAPYIFMVRYLCNGKEAVSGCKVIHKKPHRFWPEEGKPVDFNTQLIRILTVLDKHVEPDNET